MEIDQPQDVNIGLNCPICGRADIGDFTFHLQLHSKQDLIQVLMNHSAALKPKPLPPQQSHCSTSLVSSIATAEDGDETSAPHHHHHGRRGSTPSKKLQSSNPKSHGGRRKSATISSSTTGLGVHGHAHDSKGSSDSRHGAETEVISKITPTSNPVETHAQQISESNYDVGENGLVCEVGIPYTEFPQAGGASVICSFVLPTSEVGLDNAERKFQTLYPVPVDPLDSNNPSQENPTRSNIIKYIIDETGKNPVTTEAHGPSQEWILPDGITIPVYSSFNHVAVSGKEAANEQLSAISVVEENNSLGRTHSSSTGMDLMTDEEIPPRGEISEYEESNTSSHQSDELNKLGSRTSASTHGSVFSDLRRSPNPLADRLKTQVHVTIVPPKSTKRKSKEKSSPKSIADRHKCPDPDCSQVGSIFELAQHQAKAHQKIKSPPEFITAENLPTAVKTDIKLERWLETNAAKEAVPKEYHCVYCDFVHVSKKELNKHVKSMHPGKPEIPEEFECSTCGKVFGKRSNLVKHLLIHGVKKFGCGTCGKGFTSGFKLKEHFRVHTKEYPFQCVECYRNFRTPSLLKAHMNRIHPLPGEERKVTPKLEFVCNLCHKTLLSKRSLHHHYSLHMEKPKKCWYCPEIFPRSAVLIRHIRMSHDPTYESQKSKCCPICKKQLHPNSMKSHMRIHNSEKPFPCHVCNKSFRTYANLTSHQWSHTNADKPYKCKVCSKSYLFKKNLDSHLIVHKRKTFHFVCNECGMKFTSKVNMKRHAEEHFSEKKHKCTICNKAFHRKYYLVEHERIHNGIKPFTCSICGKSSATKSNHRAHLKIHDARESGTLEG